MAPLSEYSLSAVPSAFAKGTFTRWMCYGFSVLALLFFIFLIVAFAYQSIPVWKHEGWDYLIGEIWYYRAERFGILPMIYGTVAIVTLSLFLAAPIAVASAILASEYLPRPWRIKFKITIELLAGIPSVVYGLLGVLFLRNWIYNLFEDFDILSGDTLLTASVLLAVMILPTIMTLCDDAFKGVSHAQRLASRNLGLTRSETICRVVIPQAMPGIVAAFLLALGRSLGETIAVFLVVGRQDNQLPESIFSWSSFLESGQTITSKLGGAETYIAYGDPLHWGAMMGLALVLLLIVVACSTGAHYLLGKISRGN